MTTQPARVPLARTSEEQLVEERFLDLYGRWEPWSPSRVVEELAHFDRPWWVVGGWAIEAAAGHRREHEDLDISMLTEDVPAFVEAMAGRWHVWNNVAGVLHPLGERWPTVDEPRSQLWLRVNAASPWVLDIPLTPSIDRRWTNKVIPDHTAEVNEVTWLADDGIRHLNPDIVLLYKARHHRPKDEVDFEAALPLLTQDRRVWLRDALQSTVPDHPWITRLD